jgi:hypothetical protein
MSENETQKWKGYARKAWATMERIYQLTLRLHIHESHNCPACEIQKLIVDFQNDIKNNDAQVEPKSMSETLDSKKPLLRNQRRAIYRKH